MNQIIDEVYSNYLKNGQQEADRNRENQTFLPMPKQMFINKIKTNDEFLEKWGLKIEERELSLDEKEWQLEKTNCINDIENDRIIYGHEWEKYIQEQYEGIQSTQGIKIPTRLITVTYKDEKIEIYE